MRAPEPPIIRGHIAAPYFIFIRCGDVLSDDEIMSRLDIQGYSFEPKPARFHGKQLLFITNDDNWVHIAEDWLYSLWYSKSIRDHIEDLGKQYEVFACSVADTSGNFDFEHYRGGERRRRYSTEIEGDRGYWGNLDQGQPLPAERPLSISDEPLDYVLALAASLGVDTRHRRRRIRVYSKVRDA